MTGDEKRVIVPVTNTASPEFLAYLQRITQEASERTMREMWQRMSWRRKMRIRWNRLKRVWGPA